MSDIDSDVMRIRGEVKRAFPLRGFFWLTGEDGVDYFAHQTHVQNGVRISTTWVGQPCTFIPMPEGEKGPWASSIVLSSLDDA